MVSSQERKRSVYEPPVIADMGQAPRAEGGCANGSIAGGCLAGGIGDPDACVNGGTHAIRCDTGFGGPIL